MEIKLSQEHRGKAAEYAMEALRRNPNLGDAHSLLVQAMNGCCRDWCETNHAALIRYYEAFKSVEDKDRVFEEKTSMNDAVRTEMELL